MDDLKLPIIKGIPDRSVILSMDEYCEFVEFNLKHTVDLDAVNEWKRKARVNVPFVMK